MDSVSLQNAVDAFERRGSAAFMDEVEKVPAIKRSIMLFGEDSRILAPLEAPAPRLVQLVFTTAKLKTPGLTRYDTMVALAAPIKGPSGRNYVVVMTDTVFFA